ncbi:TetR/AcrR family transcriptional regulator [candidate division KSB1 bacterium]|nr:TetR/AcrR family transcriptional regulator [candidate division KSB1 bacterium]
MKIKINNLDNYQKSVYNMTVQSVILNLVIMSPKFVDKNARKEEILTFAMSIIAKKGYSHIKMADIAREADMGKGTLYEYFDSKEALFASAFDKFRKDIGTFQAKKLREVTGAVEKLKELTASWVELISLAPDDHLELMTDFWSEGIRNKDAILEGKPGIRLRQAYMEYRMLVEKIIVKGIRTGQFEPVEPFYTAAVIVGAIDGLILQWLIDRKSIDIENAMDILFDTLMSGIGVSDK